MKKLVYIAVTLIGLTSCGVQSVIIPKATNTVSTASFKDLNLARADYEILNTITAEAVIISEEKSNKNGQNLTLTEENNEFELKFYDDRIEHKGIVRLGYLASDYTYDPDELRSAESLARRLAIYRLINIAQQNGADGIIEPTVSTAFEQVGNKTIRLKTTAVAKIIKLTPNK